MVWRSEHALKADAFF